MDRHTSPHDCGEGVSKCERVASDSVFRLLVDLHPPSPTNAKAGCALTPSVVVAVATAVNTARWVAITAAPSGWSFCNAPVRVTVPTVARLMPVDTEATVLVSASWPTPIATVSPTLIPVTSARWRVVSPAPTADDIDVAVDTLAASLAASNSEVASKHAVALADQLQRCDAFLHFVFVANLLHGVGYLHTFLFRLQVHPARLQPRLDVKLAHLSFGWTWGGSINSVGGGEAGLLPSSAESGDGGTAGEHFFCFADQLHPDGDFLHTALLPRVAQPLGAAHLPAFNLQTQFASRHPVLVL